MRKATSRPKTTKSPVRRSAPIPAQPEHTIGGEGGWAIVPASTPLGLSLIDQRKRAANTFELLDDNGSDIRSARADEAADTFAMALSYLPPHGAIEALVAVLLIKDDLDAALAGVNERIRDNAGEALKRRVAGLAAWIELTHKVDRSEHGFHGGGQLADLIPHTAKVLNVMAEHDR